MVENRLQTIFQRPLDDQLNELVLPRGMIKQKSSLFPKRDQSSKSILPLAKKMAHQNSHKSRLSKDRSLLGGRRKLDEEENQYQHDRQHKPGNGYPLLEAYFEQGDKANLGLPSNLGDEDNLDVFNMFSDNEPEPQVVEPQPQPPRMSFVDSMRENDEHDLYYRKQGPQPRMQRHMSFEPRKKLIQCLDPHEGYEYANSRQALRIEKIRAKKRARYDAYLQSIRYQDNGTGVFYQPEAFYRTINEFFKRRPQAKHASRVQLAHRRVRKADGTYA